jgi:hypothetical protein
MRAHADDCLGNEARVTAAGKPPRTCGQHGQTCSIFSAGNQKGGGGRGGAQVTVLGAVCVWLPNLRGSCPYGLSWNVWVVGAQVPACLLFAPPNPLPRTRTVEQRIGPSGLPHEPGGHTINTEIDAWGRGIFNFLLC